MQEEQMIGSQAETGANDAHGASQPYVGMWQRLISRTNWEKGSIICEWRDALVADGAPASDYSDETWGRLVGGVSSQHVGRLRRVYRRFGETHDKYQGLYCSHFCAAIDWNDAEMWLEGGVRNGWSVAQMRAQRWQTLGLAEPTGPVGESADASRWDEDGMPAELGGDPLLAPSVAGVQDAAAAPREIGQETDPSEMGGSSEGSEGSAAAGIRPGEGVAAGTGGNPVKPLEDLPPLPDDLAEAFEAFKLALLKHKLSGWCDVACDDVLRSLDGLKRLAVAPAGAP